MQDSLTILIGAGLKTMYDFVTFYVVFSYCFVCLIDLGTIGPTKEREISSSLSGTQSMMISILFILLLEVYSFGSVLEITFITLLSVRDWVEVSKT